MSRYKTIILSILILVISAGVTFIIFITEPKAQREGATKKTAMLVDVVEIQRGEYTPTVVATGNVQAARDITLSPQVEGEVVHISENFIPGSFVKKGEVLLRINPADFRNILQLRRSDLQLAKSDLSIEMGRQDVARKDYELIGDELSPDNKALVLRKPQLEAARARVAAAEASVNQARLNLQRATIRAPFDAHIVSRSINVGSQVSQGVELGRLIGMDEYWVVANIPVGKVNWLTFAEEGSSSGSEVTIKNTTSWASGQYRKGKLFRLIGALDAQTRLARVLISVPDPLVQHNKSDTLPPLIMGTFVEVQITARKIPNVFRLDRDHLRKGSTVWVMEDHKLRIRQVDILFQDQEYAYIREGLSDHDKIITTDLSTVVDGADLRTEGEQPSDNPASENPGLPAKQ